MSILRKSLRPVVSSIDRKIALLHFKSRTAKYNIQRYNRTAALEHDHG